MYKNWVKRIFDLVLAILVLAFLMPLLAVVALLVRLKLGSPIIFRQQHPGLHGKSFTIYKFRTMTAAHDAQCNLLPDTQRLTPLGRFLHSASLDEQGC